MRFGDYIFVIFCSWSLRVLICYPPGGLLGVILGLLEHSWGPPGSLRTSFSPIFAPPELIFRLRGRFGAQPTGDPATELFLKTAQALAVRSSGEHEVIEA